MKGIKAFGFLLAGLLCSSWVLASTQAEIPQDLRQALSKTRHQIEVTDNGYHAFNPGNRQRYGFQSEGLMVEPATKDAELGRDVAHDDDSDGHAGFSFTKLDDNGDPLPPSAIAWSCVKDNVTGLTWEVKTDDGGLQDMDNTYTWYNPDSDNNGGDPGTRDGGSCTGSDCDTQGYAQAVKAQGLCGANDWRMPTVKELENIANLDRDFPAIDTDYFPNTHYSDNWSASPNAQSSIRAWVVYFVTGISSPHALKGYGQHVRLVRGGQYWL